MKDKNDVLEVPGGESGGTAGKADIILHAGSVVLMLSLLGVVMLQVVSRYLLPVAPMWVEELPGYLLVWMTALGACLATRDSGHARIEILADALPDPYRKITNLFATSAAIVILAIVTYYGIVSTISAAGARSVTMPLSLSWIHAAVPAMAATCIAMLVADAWNEHRKRGERS